MTKLCEWTGSIDPDDKSGMGVFLVAGMRTEPIRFESFSDFHTLCVILDKHRASEYQRGRMDVARLVRDCVGETK